MKVFAKNSFLTFLLAGACLTSSQVVSTEKDYTLSNANNYALHKTTFQSTHFLDTIPSNPNVFEAVLTYADADLTQPETMIKPNGKLDIEGLYYNNQQQPVFKLSDGRFLLADANYVYDNIILTREDVELTVYLAPGFTFLSTPIENQSHANKSKYTAYTPVKVNQIATTHTGTYYRLQGIGWLESASISLIDNRMEKIQDLLEKKYQSKQYSIYVHQLDTGLTAGVNQDVEMYSASISKLPILYYTQSLLDEGSLSLTDSFKYTKAATNFKGAYQPSGAGHLPKKPDNKPYKLLDLVQQTTQASDNVASNLLAYYVTQVFDTDFQNKIQAAIGSNWPMVDKKVSAKTAGLMMAAIYEQDGQIIDYLSDTEFDTTRISKDIKVQVAHKIGDAYDYKHDVAIVYTDSPFILSIFTNQSDYDTISKIANEIYNILK